MGCSTPVKAMPLFANFGWFKSDDSIVLHHDLLVWSDHGVWSAYPSCSDLDDEEWNVLLHVYRLIKQLENESETPTMYTKTENVDRHE